MNVTPEVLAELRRRHLNATAAPWVVEEHMDGMLTVETSNEAIWKRLNILQIDVDGRERLRGENNGRFIALVRNNIGALLDELEAVRAERDMLRADVATYQRTMSICVSEGHKDAVNLVELQAERDRLREALRECAEGLEFFMSKAGCPTESSSPKADAESFGYFHTLRDARAALGAAP